jgi:hypothetical protein
MRVKTTGIILIFLFLTAIICIPAMGISKSDLIAFYKDQPFPDQGTPETSANFSVSISFSHPTTLPTPTPTPYVASWGSPTPIPTSGNSSFPSWILSPSWMIPWKSDSSLIKPIVTPTPTSPPSSPTSYTYPPSCPPAVPIRYLEHTWCSCMAYRNEITGEVVGEECINPDTGQRYPIGKDALGNLYIVKPGCPIKWID